MPHDHHEQQRVCAMTPTVVAKRLISDAVFEGEFIKKS